MVLTERELEEQLLEAGKRLLQPPSSSDELLRLLDQVEDFLSKVDQSPSRSMLNALSPSMKALIGDEFLQNPNEDVKVAAASCISEITRITAPDAPYEDEQMKEVFQLIVSSFENLSDKSSHSYSKRTSILETVAKVRSCVVMLDLECDALIVEMFQHFLKAIRDHHPENVFSSMETIMTLVLEESEDVALDLISPLLTSLKKDNQEVQPIARKLAEKVFGNCAAKIKPCLIQAKNSVNFSFDDYSTIISTICEETSHVVEHDNHKSSEEQLDEMNKESITETLSEQDHHASKDTGLGKDHHAPIETGSGQDHSAPVEIGPGEDHSAPLESGQDHPAVVEICPQEDHPAPEMSPKSVTSNGIVETKNEDVPADTRSSEKLEHANEEDQSLDANVANITESGDSESRKIEKVISKSVQISKKRSRKPKHSTKSAVHSEASHVDPDEANKPTIDVDRNPDKELHASPSRDPSIDVAVHEETENETKQMPASPSRSLLEEGRPRKDGRSKRKKKLIEETSRSENAATKKASEGTEITEVKLQGRLGKKTHASDTHAGKAQVLVKTSKVESGSGSVSDTKVVEKSNKNVDAEDHTGVGSSAKKKADGKRLVRGKTKMKKESDSSPKPATVVKDVSPLEEAPKTSSKRKRIPSEEKVTDVKLYGEDIIGARVKVWWPLDKMYYEGVIDSFDRTLKKHKVLYTDGEYEVLNLSEEKWTLIGDDVSMKDGEQETRVGSSDTSPEVQRKKKGKTGSEQSSKKGKTGGSSRDGAASSSRSKGADTKSGRKAVDDIKDDVKLRDIASKSNAKSEDVKGKSEVRSKKYRGKSSVVTSEKAGKSKDENGDTPKPNIRFKLGSPKPVSKDAPKTATKDTLKSDTKETSKTASKDTPKSVIKETSKTASRDATETGTKDDSECAEEDAPKTAMKDTRKTVGKNSKKGGLKSKTSKSGSNSGVNRSGRVKSGSAKGKEIEDEEKSPEVVKAPEGGKGKSPETSKGKETDGKSGKKRRRGVKS